MCYFYIIILYPLHFGPMIFSICIFSCPTYKKPSCCWDSRSYCVGNFDPLK